MPPDSIPDGYRCIACDYKAGGLPGYVCPECGEPVTDEALVVWRARVELGRRLTRLLITRLAAAAALCVVYSAGAAAFAQDAGAAGAAFTGLGVVSGGSIAVGLLAATAAPRPARHSVAALWLKHLWVLHLPWLVVGPGAIAFGSLVMIERLLPSVGALLLGLAILLAPIWLMLSGLCLVVWAQRRQRDVQLLRLRAPAVHILMMLCAIATLAAAILLGSIGGSLAVLGPLTADIFPGEEF